MPAVCLRRGNRLSKSVVRNCQRRNRLPLQSCRGIRCRNVYVRDSLLYRRVTREGAQARPLLVLVGSRVVWRAVSIGRSSSRKANFLLQKRGVWCLAYDIARELVWVPIWANPADAPSHASLPKVPPPPTRCFHIRAPRVELAWMPIWAIRTDASSQIKPVCINSKAAASTDRSSRTSLPSQTCSVSHCRLRPIQGGEHVRKLESSGAFSCSPMLRMKLRR